MIAVLFEADALPQAQEISSAGGRADAFAIRHAGVYCHRALSEPEYARQNTLVILVGR